MGQMLNSNLRGLIQIVALSCPVKAGQEEIQMMPAKTRISVLDLVRC